MKAIFVWKLMHIKDRDKILFAPFVKENKLSDCWLLQKMHDCWPYFSFQSCTLLEECLLLLNRRTACEVKTLMDVKGVQKVNIERKCEFVVREIVSRLKSKVKVCVFKKNVMQQKTYYSMTQKCVVQVVCCLITYIVCFVMNQNYELME